MWPFEKRERSQRPPQMDDGVGGLNMRLAFKQKTRAMHIWAHHGLSFKYLLQGEIKFKICLLFCDTTSSSGKFQPFLPPAGDSC